MITHGTSHLPQQAFPDDDEDRIFSWFRTPPKYTVIRINPLKTDLDQFLLKLESFLQQVHVLDSGQDTCD